MAAGTTAVFTFCINAPLFHICILTVTETLSMRLYEHSYGCKWVKVLLSSNKQTNQVTEWSRVILRKLIDPLLVKFSMCYGIQRFITIFPCLLLHIPNDIYIYIYIYIFAVSVVSSCFFNLYFNIIILFIHRLSKWSLFFRFTNKKSLCSSLFLHTCHIPCPSHPPSYDHPHSGEPHKFWSSSLCNFI